MKLYLMQHALAYPAEENPDRPLTPKGIEQSKSAATGIKKLDIKPDLILTSPKRRAQQTAALIAEKIRYPYSDILSSEAVLPRAPVPSALELLKKEANQDVLLVGHMPHLSNLSSHLLGGARLTFENTGLTCLELSDEGITSLLFHLTAHQLENQ